MQFELPCACTQCMYVFLALPFSIYLFYLFLALLLALPKLLLKISRLLSHLMNVYMCFWLYRVCYIEDIKVVVLLYERMYVFLAQPFLARIYVNEQINKILCTKFSAKSAVLPNFYSHIIYISRLYILCAVIKYFETEKSKTILYIAPWNKNCLKNKNSQAVCNKIRTLIKLIVIFSFLTTFNNNYAKQCQNNIVLSLHMTECKINVRLYFYYFRFM